MGAPKVSGDINPKFLRKWSARWTPRAVHCYDNALSSHGEMDGVLQLSFDVRPGGRVKNTEVAEGPLPKLLTDCMVDLVPNSAPASADGKAARIEIPIEFSPSNAAKK